MNRSRFLPPVLCGVALLLSSFAAVPLCAQAQDAPAPEKTDVAGDLPPDTEALLKRLPDNSSVVLTLDLGDDNPNMEFVRPSAPKDDRDLPSWQMTQAMHRDLRDGFMRMMGLFGIKSNLFERLTGAMGPRFVAGVVPGAKNSPPNLLLLSSVKDQGEAEDRLRELIGTVARNATETVTEVGPSRLHTWSHLFETKMSLSYLVTEDAVALSTDPALLRAATTASGGAIPGWMNPLMEASRRGLFNSYVSPNLLDLFGKPEGAPDLKGMGIQGSVSCLTVAQEGLTLTSTTLFSKEGKVGKVLSSLSGAPTVTDDAFRRVPEGSLMALAVGKPSAWVKSIQDSLPEDAQNLGLPFLSLIPTIFDGDVTFSLRSALPLPSGLITVAGTSEAGTTDKMAALRTFARQLNMNVQEVTEDKGQKVTQVKIGAGPYQNLLVAQQGSVLVASTDRRTLEEAAALNGSDAGSLLNSDAFQTVRQHLGENPNLILYADLNAFSGAGMILSHAMFMGNPVGQELARMFRSMGGFGLGVQLQPDRYNVTEFVAGDPSRVLPVIGGMSLGAGIAGAAFAFPVMTSSRDSARASSCESNLKQVALGTLMYAQDYDETFPRANQWTQQLKPYVKNENVFHCPSADGSGVSYAMNQKLSRAKMSSITDPANTILFYETTESGGSPNGLGANQAYRHEGGTVVAYADGHVARLMRALTASDFQVARTPAKTIRPQVKPKPAVRNRTPRPALRRPANRRPLRVRSRY